MACDTLSCTLQWKEAILIKKKFNFPENVPTLDVEFEKSSEVAGSFSEIPVMRRRKSHALDSTKVDRYRTSR